jgi:hypothetical protein
MIRSTLFPLLCLFVLTLTVNSCDGDEVDITNSQIDPPMIETEPGIFNYTMNGKAKMDTGFSFVCRTDSLESGIFNHSYVATNVDVSGLSDTNSVLPVAQGDLAIGGYTDDVTDVGGIYLYFMAEIAVGETELVRCFDCPITMVDDDGVLSGTFSGTLTTSNPDSVFVITDGTFEVPLIELDCN